MRIGDLIAHRAVSSPERVYWEEHGRGHTYAELHRTANRVARALAAEGTEPGAHVAICADNGFAYLCAHFGTARAGAVLAHLNARFTAAELAALAAHADARVLFFGPRQTETVAAARAHLPEVRRFVRLPDAVPSAEDAPSPAWAVDWEPWLAGHAEADLPPELTGRIDPAAPFQLLYTSGTTGTPKGALVSHRAKLAQGTTHALNLGLVPGDRILSALPLYHQYAQWLVGVSAPVAGATVVAHRGFDAAATWAALATERITHLPLVPTTLYRLLDAPEAAAARRAPPPHLRCIVYGGAPIDPARIPQVRETFPGVRLFQGFGQTEAGYCLGLMDEDHETHAHALGRPDLFSEVRLVDEAGRDVATGAVGEILVRTPYLMNGYYKDPEATAAYFAHGAGWGRTGDLATRDEDGFYTLAGRKRELIIRGGVNVYPGEVEQVLCKHPTVADAAVYGVPDPDLGERVAAAVIARSGARVEPGVLDAHCRAVLAAFKCPAEYHVVQEFPRTASGKVRKFALRAAPAAD